MLKKLFNECTFKLILTPVDPILVKSGYATISGPDMSPVTTWRNGEFQVFLPGSSLKGVFRSHAERVIRTIKEGIVCIPYQRVEQDHRGPKAKNYDDVFCGNKFQLRRGRLYKEDLSNETIYRESCPACRLFGSTDFIGRIAISDAYLQEDSPVSVERRDGVGIDRFTGGAAHRAKFELEVVSRGIFETTIRLRNFEIWQLGMIAVILQDLRDNLFQIGSGKSRGLGTVHGEVSEFTIMFLKSPVAEAMPAGELWGLGKFLEEAEEDYGTDENDVLKLTSPLQRDSDSNEVRILLPLEQERLQHVLKRAAEVFIEKMKGWAVPETMRFSHVKRV